MTRDEYRAQVRSQLLIGKAMTYFRWYIATGEHPDADPAGEGWLRPLEVSGVNIGRVPTPRKIVGLPKVPPGCADFGRDEDDEDGPREKTIVGPPMAHLTIRKRPG